MMTVRDFLEHVRETEAAGLAAPNEPQTAFVRWVHAFDLPDSGLKSLVLWTKASHWAYPVGFFMCEVERPGALQLGDGDHLPLDLHLGIGEIFEDLTPDDLRLADEAVHEFIAAMQRSEERRVGKEC